VSISGSVPRNPEHKSLIRVPVPRNPEPTAGSRSWEPGTHPKLGGEKTGKGYMNVPFSLKSEEK